MSRIKIVIPSYSWKDVMYLFKEDLPQSFSAGHGQ